eukprot:s9_g52.t1
MQGGSGVRFFAEDLAFPVGGALAFAFFGGGDGFDTAAETDGPAGDALAGTSGALLEGCPDFFGLFNDCETADEKLDRLIQMERRFREGSELQVAATAPEVRRLVMTDGGAGAAGATSVPPGDGGRTTDLAAGGALLPLQPGPELPAPDGMLVPLFHGLGDDEARGVQPRRLDLDDEPPQQGGGTNDRLDFGHQRDDGLVLMGSQGRQLQSEEPRNGGLLDAGMAAVGGDGAE